MMSLLRQGRQRQKRVRLNVPTFAEFQTLCPDSAITEQQYNALENRAESDIDTLTFNRITAIGFNNLTAFQRDKVRLALSQQTAFVFDNAELLDSPLSSYSISGVSMSFDSSKVINYCGVTTTRQIYNTLLQTGLCYRGL